MEIKFEFYELIYVILVLGGLQLFTVIYIFMLGLFIAKSINFKLLTPNLVIEPTKIPKSWFLPSPSLFSNQS